jgi:hypothetical protein
MWLNEVSFYPCPRSSWQAAVCVVAGPGARVRDTIHGKHTCSCSLTRTLGRNHINANVDKRSKGTDGTTSGTNAKAGRGCVYASSRHHCCGRGRYYCGRGRKCSGRRRKRNGHHGEKKRVPARMQAQTVKVNILFFLVL